MSLFGRMFQSKPTESLIFIDISASTVAGAYVFYKKGAQPEILYTRRLPIESHKGELEEKAMLRALEMLGNALVSEGAPALMRHTGTGSASAVLISIDAPWQTTDVHTETFEKNEPFVFTKGMVDTALEKTAVDVPGKLLVDESIIGTTLNGYETNEPFGKKVHRASVIVLTSLINEKVSQDIERLVRGFFHTKNILSIAGSSLRYQAIRKAFPHERNAIILDAIGSLLSVSLVRGGYLVAVTEMSERVSAKSIDSWARKVINEFAELAKRFPLPRTIFLLTQEQDVEVIEKALDVAKLAGLWLSENPPKIVSVLASHLSGPIKQLTTATPDLPLILMSLYWLNRSGE